MDGTLKPRKQTGIGAEALLSIAACAVVLVGALLALAAGLATGPGRGAIDVNTASAVQISTALSIPPAAAAAVVAARENRGSFPADDAALLIIRKSSPADVPPARLIVVRTATQVAVPFLTAFGLLALVFVVGPWLLPKENRGDPFLFPLALLLSGLGAVMLFCVKDPFRDREVYLHQMLAMVAALAAFVCATRMSATFRDSLRRTGYVSVLIAFLLAIALLLFGHGPGGIRLDLLGVQPVEAIKILVVLSAAAYLATHSRSLAAMEGRHGMGLRFQDAAPPAVMFGVALGMFLILRDLGPALLLFGAGMALFYVATGRSAFLAFGLALAVGGALLAYQSHVGVFSMRVDMWLHPWHNRYRNGLHLAQSYWAIATGGVEGCGLGLGLSAVLPRAGSDMALASWCEQTGLVGAFSIIVLFAVLLWRGLRIAEQAATEYDRLLAAGFALLAGLQALLVSAGVTGAAPLTGAPLPFFAYGGTALVASWFMLGVLYSISRRPARRPSAGAGSSGAPVKLLAISIGGLLVLGIGLLRLGELCTFGADSAAARAAVTPDADGVLRPHRNPRILAVERMTPRGSIYDSQGRVIATSSVAEAAATGLPGAAAAVRRAGRFYPYGAALAHPVGFYCASTGAASGLEERYNGTLRGWNSDAQALQIWRNRALPGSHTLHGSALRLTLDADLQKAIWESATKLDAASGTSGIAFTMLNARTGAVIASVSLPAFDPNAAAAGRQTGASAVAAATLDRAVNGLYPPGSTFKIATAAYMLSQLPAMEARRILCNRVSGRLRWSYRGAVYSRSNIHDDPGDPAFGSIGISTAFRVSSNIYFATQASRFPPDSFRSFLQSALRFHHVPPEPEFAANLADIGYGQGAMVVTPLELARLCAATANGGMMPAPKMLAASEVGGSWVAPAVTPARTAFSVATAGQIVRLMRSVVTGGTARGDFGGIGLTVAGKTGTAQTGSGPPDSLFVGFAPYPPDAGSAAFACVVEHGGYGRGAAASLCRKALQTWRAEPP